jgi:hypothetical protein
MRRLALMRIGLAVLAFGGLGAGGCNVGQGKGTAKGNLFVVGCWKEGDEVFNYGEQLPGVTAEYDLKPTFFAGDPIEDIGIGEHKNRLRMRMQKHGSGQEDDDMLKFDIENSYEVARCVRGRTVNGAPDWDMSKINTMNGHVALPGEEGIPWCDWSALTTDAGAGMSVDAGVSTYGPRARLHFSTEGFTKAWLVPLSSCPMIPVVGIGRVGWIELIDFGKAGQPELPPEERTRFETTDFKVNFGERLRATFHVELQDSAVWQAEEHLRPVPNPRIGGVLDGEFDFILERSRVAQPFP